MEILVCVKRVPDTAENEIEVNRDGSDIERDDLVYSVNEWDNYAVEEAIQIVDKTGGAVTVVSLGDEESEDVVRREMAMGANNGILASDDAFEGSDGKGVATILKGVVDKGNYDLILTGAQADDGAGQGHPRREGRRVRDLARVGMDGDLSRMFDRDGLQVFSIRPKDLDPVVVVIRHVQTSRLVTGDAGGTIQVGVVRAGRTEFAHEQVRGPRFLHGHAEDAVARFRFPAARSGV